MYRVMVVNSNMDDPGSVSRAIDREDLIPYDTNDYAWAPACKVREAALKLFPAVIIIWKGPDPWHKEIII